MKGDDPARIEEAYRRKARAAELRRMGKKWDDIASEVGYANKSNAFRAVKELLAESRELAYGEADLYRQESLDRLTMLLEAALPRALKGDEKMMREARLIIGQMDELTGARAPVKVEIGESDVDRLLREALEEHRRRADLADRQADGVSADQARDGGAEPV